MIVSKKTNAQDILDSLPVTIKNLIKRSLYISVHALKEEKKEITYFGFPDVDTEIDDLIENMNYLHDRLGRELRDY